MALILLREVIRCAVLFKLLPELFLVCNPGLQGPGRVPGVFGVPVGGSVQVQAGIGCVRHPLWSPSTPAPLGGSGLVRPSGTPTVCTDRSRGTLAPAWGASVEVVEPPELGLRTLPSPQAQGLTCREVRCLTCRPLKARQAASRVSVQGSSLICRI